MAIPFKNTPKEEVLNFIRERLAFPDDLTRQLRHVSGDDFKKEHRRFDMSGCENVTGWATVFNTAILNEFASLGIYDYTEYLFLDFYKGCPTVYLKYFNDPEEKNQEFDFSSLSTSEIIYEIFRLTIFSGRRTRKRL